MITIDQLNEIVSTGKLQVPASTLQCVLDTVNSKEDCLTALGLSECIIQLCQITAAQLLMSNLSGGRTVKSQGADVISVSYQTETASTVQKAWYNQLATWGALDCFSDVISVPVGGPYSFAFVGVGCK
jgi:hypothetical protein